MKYLLDTHAIIWYFEDSGELSENTLAILRDKDCLIHISSASIWETAIKISLGKLDLDFNKLLEHVRKSDFSLLQVDLSYLKKLMSLPFIHRDPFDRLLIATALATGMTIITADKNIHQYEVQWIW